MARGTSILEFAVENFPNNTPQLAPPEDHFLWEDGPRRAAGEVAMDEILLHEGGLACISHAGEVHRGSE
jgi:hypothetical protein